MRIGVIGGGQLGRMLAEAGAGFDARFTFLDPSSSACAALHGRHLEANWDDKAALELMLINSDVITFEFENVSSEVVAMLAEQRPAYPPAAALATARDRWSEKSLFRSLDIPLPPVAKIDGQADLDTAIADIGLPAVLKTRTLGYDGKGQKVLRQPDDVTDAFAELGHVPLVLEGFVDFDYEVSVIAVRDQYGATRAWPLVRNEHRQGMLHCSVPEANHPLQALAEDYANRALAKLGYVGVMAFEFFVVGDALLANEIAPRVHNSGHWTIEGAETSQFENHLRAIAGLPLGSTARLTSCAMLNIIGAFPDRAAVLAIPGTRWHDYGKEPRPGRKIGHITVLGADDEQLQERLAAVEKLLVNDLG